MSSFLKQEIDAFHDRYLEPVGRKVVAHFMRQFREVNEMDSITEFEANICWEDDRDFWEEVVCLADCDRTLLAERVGVALTFPNARTCNVRWSGK